MCLKWKRRNLSLENLQRKGGQKAWRSRAASGKPGKKRFGVEGELGTAAMPWYQEGKVSFLEGGKSYKKKKREREAAAGYWPCPFKLVKKIAGSCDT